MTFTLQECTLTVTDDFGWAHVAVAGELDLGVTDDLQSLLVGESQAGRSIVLDLRGVTFMDSSGLTAILRALAVARELDLGFTLRGPLPESVEWVARICGVLETLPVAA
jgi:anti-anti-sigma factor